MLKLYFCAECGNPCDVKSEDMGIGSYEYCGQKGFHTDYQYGSACCFADVVNEEGKSIDYDVLFPEPEPEYEPPNEEEG